MTNFTEFVTPNITPYSDFEYVCVVFCGFQTLRTVADFTEFVTPNITPYSDLKYVCRVLWLPDFAYSGRLH